MNNMCMHCLEEGEWSNEDVCPSCKIEGHVSPWEVSKCPVCNKQYFDAIDKIKRDIDLRQNINESIADLQSRVRKLEEWIYKKFKSPISVQQF